MKAMNQVSMKRLTIALLSMPLAATLMAQSVPPRTHLKVGDMAPDFELPSTRGTKVKLSSFLGKKNVVLAFYPAAFTGGCTQEMSGYQANITKFEGADTEVFGISTDNTPSQAEFARKLAASSFVMLSDFAQRKVTAAYGVLMPDRGISNRGTFVVNKADKISYIEEGQTAVDIAGTAEGCSRVALKTKRRPERLPICIMRRWWGLNSPP
jgi:peroxiredoxin